MKLEIQSWWIQGLQIWTWAQFFSGNWSTFETCGNVFHLLLVWFMKNAGTLFNWPYGRSGIYLRSSSIEAGVSRKPFQVFENLKIQIFMEVISDIFFLVSMTEILRRKTYECNSDQNGICAMISMWINSVEETWPWWHHQCSGGQQTKRHSWSGQDAGLQSQCTWGK